MYIRFYVDADYQAEQRLFEPLVRPGGLPLFGGIVTHFPATEGGLNVLGRDGWEVVSVITYPEDYDGSTHQVREALLKRRIA
jgi:hypothetical protein